jgi:ABC-type molybdate transport system substrate-binding protein
MGLFDELRPRMRFVENSRAVVAAMRDRGPRIGIVFESDVANAVGVKKLLQIPISRIKTVYEGAAIVTSRVIGEATALLQFLKSKTAQECFHRCGLSS